MSILTKGQRVLVIDRLNNQSMNVGFVTEELSSPTGRISYRVFLEDHKKAVRCVAVWPIKAKKCFVAIPAK